MFHSQKRITPFIVTLVIFLQRTFLDFSWNSQFSWHDGDEILNFGMYINHIIFLLYIEQRIYAHQIYFVGLLITSIELKTKNWNSN